jgi:hypothetical protein
MVVDQCALIRIHTMPTTPAKRRKLNSYYILRYLSLTLQRRLSRTCRTGKPMSTLWDMPARRSQCSRTMVP